jgi:hypothetical protein
MFEFLDKPGIYLWLYRQEHITLRAITIAESIVQNAEFASVQYEVKKWT